MPIISGQLSYGTTSDGQVPAPVAGDTARPWSINPNLPSATITGAPVAVGDWMIVICTSQSPEPTSRTPTAPASWSVLCPFQTVGGTGTMSIGIWAKKRLADETSYSWTVNNDINRNGGTQYRILWVKGALDISQWTIGSFVDRASNATTTTAVAPSVTTSVPATLGLCIAAERTLATETEVQVTMSNFTKTWFSVVTDVMLLTGTKAIEAPSPTGDVTVTYPNVHVRNALAGILAIPGSYEQPGLPVKRSDGAALQNAFLQISNGAGGLTNPESMRIVKPGYSSVTGMLSSSPFFVAHRGGSRDFPEMSLYAYGQSVLHGYGALELSLARTSDGVWFGLHDQDINRTSGTSGLPPASSMTWAQIQAYDIKGATALNNPSQPNRRYMRFDELIAAYYNSHILVIDIKYVATQQAEFVAMISSLPGNPTERIIGKAFGVGSAFSNAMKAAGFKSWGYFYEAQHLSGELASYQNRWDILGMDYSASAASWAEVTSYGKPVMGHICPNAAARDAALGYGAQGVMSSGALSIIPTSPYSNK